MRNGPRAACLAVFAMITASAPAGAWDYPGHRIVGTIADATLNANYQKTRDAVAKLLNARDSEGNVLKRSLRDVAVLPDCAKMNNVPFCGRTPSKEEVAYVARNPNNTGYHFSDAPLEQPKYV